MDCQHLFQKREKKTFAEWLEYDNNLDVSPFMEVKERMRGFYVEPGVDIFKDAVSPRPRWWWWRENNTNVVAVVEGKQYKCGGGGGGKTIQM